MAKEKAAGRSAYGVVPAAVLFLILAVLMLSGREKEEIPVTGTSASEAELLSDEQADAESLADLDSGEDHLRPERLEERETFRETDDITMGIDVSKFQETIDWGQVAESGVDFAMIRVGCRKSVAGEIVEDECARYNLKEAAANGIQIGAYFFSTAVDEAEAEEEAEWVCRILEGYPVSYPVVYNCEGFQEETSRQYGMTVEERTALACVFLDRIEEAGYTGMFYAARSELEDSLFWDTETLEQRYRIWVAQYLSETYPEIPGPEYGGSFAMWQYTDGGTVPGIQTVVDLNVAYFGYEETVSTLEDNEAEK